MLSNNEIDDLHHPLCGLFRSWLLGKALEAGTP